MSAAHTPGPWGVQDDHGKRWIETSTSNDDTIAEIHRRNTKVGRMNDVEFNANAYLIAAAPELFRVAQLVKEAASHRADKDWPMFHLAVSEAAELAETATRNLK